jgi:protein-L-isoaspartate O-methyltransferase
MEFGEATVFSAILCVCVAACDMPTGISPNLPDAEVPSQSFTASNRSSAPIVSSRWSTEEARDKAREADTVMEIAATTSGMTVADIGAGEGYYTVRLAEKVGSTGRVLAQDIIPAVKAKLASRIDRERWDNVSVALGTEADPKLPENSFDRIFMVHMYHEITRPYEFLWRLRPSLRMGGRVIVVDGNRTIAEHGTPPELLDCEMRAVGFHRVDLQQLPSMNIYIAAYEVSGLRPAPDKIKACP